MNTQIEVLGRLAGSSILVAVIFILSVEWIPGATANLSDTQTHPFDFGDFIAMVIIVILVVGGIFACLGQYARSQAGR